MKAIIGWAVVLVGALQILINIPAALAQQSVTDSVTGFAFCNTAIFSSNDSFAQNLDAVAKSLTQNSSEVSYSLLSSQTGSQSNHVFAMYQCRGDLSLPDCTSCVVNGLAAFQTGSLCGTLARGVRAQYIGCYLRYESYFFSNASETAGNISVVAPTCTGSRINDSSYKKNLGIALADSASAAPQHPLFGYNASSAGSASNNTAYALTQCLGYLTPSACAACLCHVSNYSNACNSSVSGQVYFNPCYYLFSNSPLVFTYNNTPPTVNSPDAAPSQAPAGAAVPLPQTTTAPAIASERSKNQTAIIVGIVVGAACAIVLAMTMAVCYLKRRKKTIKSGGEICIAENPVLEEGEVLTNYKAAGAKRFSVKELEDATDNFHPRNKLGQGGFGPVYQGRLKSGIEVAIKLLSAQSHQGKTEFVNEVNLITTVQHRNLIQLIGFCVDNIKPLLVYEYLPNRSLDLRLFDVDENDALDWHARFNIITGIARGLRYLHEDSHVRIIHRDIKASNILLDNNLDAKVADFGLARLFADDRSHLTTRVVGTLGYLAPEYAMSGQLTEKVDVYSFGLVVLEIVSGRRVVEPKFEADKQNLLEWTWALYEKQQQLQVVDKRIQQNSSTNVNMHVNVGEVIRVVHVALLCTQSHPQARPSMSEVHTILCGQPEILNLPIKPITIGMLSPITNLLHDGSFGMSSSSTIPSWTSQPSSQLRDSYNEDPISEVEPR